MTNLVISREDTVPALVQQCAAVRSHIVLISSTRCTDCVTLSRMVGKLMLLLEALPTTITMATSSTPLLSSSIDLGDIADALQSVGDSITLIGRMSRLQALLSAEIKKGAFQAAVADLLCAAASLEPLQGSLMPDAREDLASLRRQLSTLRFLDPPESSSAAASLVDILTLVFNRAAPPALAQDPLETALGFVHLSLSPLEASAWLDEEVSLLARASDEAAHSGDDVAAFQFCQLAVALLAWASGALQDAAAPDSPASKMTPCTCARETVEGAGCQEAWVKLMASSWWSISIKSGLGINGEEEEEEGQFALLNSTCFPCAFNVSLSTLNAVQASVDKVAEKGRLPQNDYASWCGELAALNDRSDLKQYVAATLVGHAAAGAGAVSATTNGQTSKTAKVLSAGAVQALRATLENSDHPVVRAAAASALRTLCRDPCGRKSTVDSGLLVPLARMVASPSAAPRRAAARALGNMFLAGDACKAAAERLGVARALVVMLGCEDALSREAAAGALANLAAKSSALQQVVGDLDVFPALSEVLRCGTPNAKQNAARALRNLASRLTSNKLKAASAGSVPHLTALLNAKDAGTRASAAACLSNLACGCSQAREEAASTGAVTALLAMLPATESAAGREAAASALANILVAPENGGPAVSDLSEWPPLETITDLLTDGRTDSGRRAAARLVKLLASGAGVERKTALAEAGVVLPLVSLLGAVECSTAQAVAGALRTLAHRSDALRGEVIRAGAAPLLVGLLARGGEGSGESERTWQEATRAIGVLTANNSFNQVELFGELGAVPLLVRVLESGSLYSQAAAANTLANLACLPANQSLILSAGAVPRLQCMLSSESPPGCREAAARAIANLAAENLPIELAECLPSVCALLTQLALLEGNNQANISAATALGNFALVSKLAAVTVARAGATSALALLCQSPVGAVREAGVLALLEVCSGAAEGRRAALESGAIPWLVQLLVLGEPVVKEAAAACLGELAREGPGARVLVDAAGGIALLQQLAESEPDADADGIAVATAATLALRALNPDTTSSNPMEDALGLEPGGSSMLHMSLRGSSSVLWGGGIVDGDTQFDASPPTREAFGPLAD